MEIRRLSRGATRDPADRSYQRTYKACIPCRQRKAKCELRAGSDGLSIGPPCAKCRREQKECVFPEKRAWERSKKRPGSSEDVDVSSTKTWRRRLNDGEDREDFHNAVSDYAPSLENNRNASTDDTSNSNENHHGRHHSTSSLGNSMMRTVVASGNDALNILFEAAAAHSRESGIHEPNIQSGNTISSRGETARDDSPACDDPAAPVQITTKMVLPVQLSRASKEVLGVWGACRFVKMGWLTSREAITLIDLFVSYPNMTFC